MIDSVIKTMFRVFYVCVILISLTGIVFGACNGGGIPGQPIKDRRERWDLMTCAPVIPFKPFFEIANMVTMVVDCYDNEKRQAELPSLIELNNLFQVGILVNKQKSLPIDIIADNKNVIANVPPNQKAVITPENGWDLISEQSAQEDIIKYNLNNQTLSTKTYLEYFPFETNDKAKFFNKKFLYQIVVDAYFKTNRFVLRPQPTNGENTIVYFKNESSRKIVVVVMYKFSKILNIGESVYFKYLNGWQVELQEI